MGDDAENRRPRVIIIGGGFGGINAAKGLKKAPVDVLVIDKHNYHLFQPLLYQVATSELEAAAIAFPIRSILHKQPNATVALAEVVGIDLAEKLVRLPRGKVHYDYLVVATGVRQSYFGNDEFQSFAPGLKSLEDAAEIRRRILLAFEEAEFEADEAARRAKLTFVIVGGGPTGVELTGAIRDVAGHALPEDFRNIDSATARVLLIHGGDRLLPTMPEDLSRKVQRDLVAMGAEIRLNSHVTDVTAEGVNIGDEFVPANNVFWAAGVEGQSVVQSLGVELDRAGRIVVGSDMSIPHHADAFVVGDAAHAPDAKTGEVVPGVAQGAIQTGDFVAKIIAKEVAAGVRQERPAFSYFDKGSMAAVGRGKAVAAVGKIHVSGFLGFLSWSMLHLLFLVGFGRKASVAWGWMVNYFTHERQARLIIGDSTFDLQQAQIGELLNELETDDEESRPV